MTNPRLYHRLLLLFLLCLPASWVAAQQTVRMRFDNASSTAVALHHRTGQQFQSDRKNFRAHRAIRPGESYVVDSRVGQEWVLFDGRTRRAVHYAKAKPSLWGGRTVVTAEDIAGVQGPSLRHQFVNRTGDTVAAYLVLGRREMPHSLIRAGRSVRMPAWPGQAWVFRSHTTNREISNFVTGRSSETVNIEQSRRSRGQGRLFDSRSEEATVTIRNQSPRPVAVYREGSRQKLHSTVPARESITIGARSGQEWTIRDPEGTTVLKTFEVARGGGEIAVSGRDWGRTRGGFGTRGHSSPTDRRDAPVSLRDKWTSRRDTPVSRRDTPVGYQVAVQNSARHDISVYRKTRTGEVLVERVRPGKRCEIQSPAGSRFYVRHPEDRRSLHEITVAKKDYSYDYRPIPPVTPSVVKAKRLVPIVFTNRRSNPVVITREENGRWTNLGTLPADRTYSAEVPSGTRFMVKDPASGRTIESVSARRNMRSVELRTERTDSVDRENSGFGRLLRGLLHGR